MRLLGNSREVKQKYWFIAYIWSQAGHFVDMEIKKYSLFEQDPTDRCFH